MYYSATRAFAQVHYPVMWRTVLRLLEPISAAQGSAPLLIGDGTLGAAGHTSKILESVPNSYVLGCDIDKEVLSQAKETLKTYPGRVQISHESYVNLGKIPRFPGVLNEGKRFDAVVLDLGMSSYQLDTKDRGFSYQHTGPLDMRFNRADPLAPTAAQIVNHASELELRELFRTYGEEPLYREAADVILRYREKQPIKTTKELSDVLNYAFFISKSINRFQSIGRCFQARAKQALRIKVNDELGSLNAFLDEIFPHMELNGVLILISFHSLEDSAVKGRLEQWVLVI